MRFFHNKDDIFSKQILNIGRMTIPMLRAEHRFQIFVKPLQGATITMYVSSSDDVHEMQVRFRNRLETEQRQFHHTSCYLTFQSKVLWDGYKLSDFHIQKNDTIRQSVRLLGGGKRARPSANEEAIPRFLGVPEVKDL